MLRRKTAAALSWAQTRMQDSTGNYIDYLSCYYVPTHDLYFEYYDGNFFLVQCSTGYVITGAALKRNPVNQEQRIDWIQCCRVGWGAIVGLPPPIINVHGRPPAYSGQHIKPVNVPSGYSHQYRKKRSIEVDVRYVEDAKTNQTINIDEDDIFMEDNFNDISVFRAPFTGDVTHHDVPVETPDLNIPESMLRM